jgi:hypothetical protein
VLSTHRESLKACLGLEVDLRGVFDAPVVEALARSVDGGRSAVPADDLYPILDPMLVLGDEQVRRVSWA